MKKRMKTQWKPEFLPRRVRVLTRPSRYRQRSFSDQTSLYGRSLSVDCHWYSSLQRFDYKPVVMVDVEGWGCVVGRSGRQNRGAGWSSLVSEVWSSKREGGRRMDAKLSGTSLYRSIGTIVPTFRHCALRFRLGFSAHSAKLAVKRTDCLRCRFQSSPAPQ
jgi:hypothetical protein